MPKLTIEIDGPLSTCCRVFVDNEIVSFLKQLEVKANADNNLLEINAVLPSFSDDSYINNELQNKINDTEKLLISCGVKCKFIEIK